MQAIQDIPATVDILDGDLTDLLREINLRFAATSRNFAELQDGDRLPATRTVTNTSAARNPYSYVNPIVNVYDFLDPLYGRLRTANMQLRELDLLPNSVGQNQLQIDSVIARHIVAGSVTADKIDVNTLSAISGNIGTITAGNITLDSAGFIRGGATSYDSGSGFWMGYSGGAYKFFLGDSAGSKITWDGSTMNITAGFTGTVDWSTQVTGAGKPADNATVGGTWGTNIGSIPTELTDGRITTALSAAGLVVSGVKPGIVVTTGTAGLYLGSDFMGYYDGAAWKTYMDNAGKFYLGGTSGALQWNGTTLAIASTSITGLGSLATASSVDWTTNVTSRPTELTDGRIATAINASGLIVSGVTPGITVTTGSAGLYLGSDFLGYYNGTAWKTYMDNTGNFYLGGTSGALQWNGTTLTITGGGTFSGALSAASGTFAGSLSAATGTFAGSLSAATGTFAGSLSAATGSFSGTITATAGTIGGWTLGTTSLTSGTGATTTGVDSGGTNPAFYAGSATPGSAPFRVTQAGALVATNATITGAITATSGSFAGSLSGATGTFAGSLSSATGTFSGSVDIGTGVNHTEITGSLFQSGGTYKVQITADTNQATLGITGTYPVNISGGVANAYISLGVSGSDAVLSQSGGLIFSTDTNLYRSAANVLKTDDAFIAVGKITSDGYAGRAGVGGTASGNFFNIEWPATTLPHLWIDVTDVGAIQISGAHTASTVTHSGYVTMKDSSGTDRKFMIGT